MSITNGDSQQQQKKEEKEKCERAVGKMGGWSGSGFSVKPRSWP